MPKLRAREQLAVWRSVYPAPCQAACPIHTDARSYVTLVGQGRLAEAYRAAREPNPLAAICGRACSAPCEDVCTRGEFDRPVAIRQLKRFLTDAFESRPDGGSRPAASGRSVAVVGAGPAGLAAAHDLARRGHAVTIYEAAPEPGGTAALGVPRFRLPWSAIRQDVRGIEALGVSVKLGVRVGRDVSLDELRQENDAVFLATGAMRPNALAAPGAHLRGIVQALAYLEEANLGREPDTGRHVAVIGGGYTAMDAARTALRLGAERVTVLYRRTRRETEVHEDELRATLKEGVHIEYLVSPAEIVDDGAGRVAAVICVRNQLGEPDASGRPRPVPIPGSEFRFPADMVILAVGQEPDPGDVDVARQGLLRRVDAKTLMTSLPGLFAGGDFVSGPTTIIEAVRAGQAAAVAIDAFLRATDAASSPQAEAWPLEVIPRPAGPAANGSQPDGPSAEGRLELDVEVEATLSREAAVTEGLRCLYCGLLPSIVIEDCTICHACVEVCPVSCIFKAALDEATGALRPAAHFGEVISYAIDSEACIRCGRCVKACPVGAIVVEV